MAGFYRKKYEALRDIKEQLERSCTLCRHLSELEAWMGDPSYAKEVYDFALQVHLNDVLHEVLNEIDSILPLLEMEERSNFRSEEVTRPDIRSSRPPELKVNKEKE